MTIEQAIELMEKLNFGGYEFDACKVKEAWSVIRAALSERANSAAVDLNHLQRVMEKYGAIPTDWKHFFGDIVQPPCPPPASGKTNGDTPKSRQASGRKT